MSQHSMRRGSVGEAQALLQIAQPLLHVVALALLLGERVARVVVAPSRAGRRGGRAAGRSERHLVPGAVGEPLGDARDALRLARQDDLVGHEARAARAVLAARRGRASDAAVVLREERRDDLLVGDLGLLDRERRRRPASLPARTWRSAISTSSPSR